MILIHCILCYDMYSTPMLQIIEEVTSNPNDNTPITLLFGNLTPKDILLKERFDAIAQKHKNFKVVYLVDEDDGTQQFKVEVGRVTEERIKKYMPPPAEGNEI